VTIDIFARYEKGEIPERFLHPRVRLVRLRLGPTGEYLPKERFWGDPIEGFVQRVSGYASRHRCCYDIVHGHYADGWFVARKLGEQWSVPFVCTTHSLGLRKLQNAVKRREGTPADLEAKYSFSTRILEEQRAISAASRVCSLTREEAAFLVTNYCADPEKVCVVPNGVKTEDFFPRNNALASSLRRELGIGERDLVVLNAGRIDERKGQRELIEAIRHLLRLEPVIGGVVRFVFVGWTGGGLAEDLTNRLEALGIMSHVILVEPVPRWDMPKFYWASDVFTLPSSYDVLPLALLEAMAAGVPVVSTNNGGPSEVILSGRNGLLVDTTDPDAFARTLLAVLKDKDYAGYLGLAGHITAKRMFNWNSTANRLMSVYREVIESAKKRETTDVGVASS
jgi:D-inositol-3-phosphate glycosyltransferase